MSVSILLVRHAAHDGLGGFLAGRAPGVTLGAAGRAQALRLGARLSGERVDAIFTSPRERARETAAAIAEARGAPEPQVIDALDEVDFGAWSGRSFEDLEEQPAWRRWNAVRSLSRTPAGESMLDVQRRVLSAIERLIEEHGGPIVLVSHSDVIKAAISYYLGLPIDAAPRFEISPASISRVLLDEWGAKLLTLNECAP